MPSQETDVLQDRSQRLFTATLALLGLLFGGGLLGLITAPTVDRRVVFLYAGAVIMGIVAAFAGLAAVNWGSMAARTRTLYKVQIAALVALFVCLLGVAGTLVYAGLLGPGDEPSQDNKQAQRGQAPAVVEETGAGRGRVAPDAEGIEPTDATASDQSPPHEDNSGTFFTYEPENVMDGIDDTAWRTPGDGEGQWIQLNYQQPVRVSAVGVIPGHDKIDAADGTDRFYQLYVVRRATIKLSDGTVMEANYERDRSMQFVFLDSPKTTNSVRLEIRDTYAPGNNPNGQSYPYLVYETAISEIEVR